MKTEITKEKKNPFLKRKELIVEIENPEESTPSKAAIQQLLAKTMHAEIEHIEIVSVTQGKGVSKANVRVNVWDEKKVGDLSKPVAKKEEAKTEAPAAKK